MAESSGKPEETTIPTPESHEQPQPHPQPQPLLQPPEKPQEKPQPHQDTAVPPTTAAESGPTDEILAEDAIEAREVNSDDAFSDDSGYEDGYISTESVASSIFQYEEENGRTYHAFQRGKYVVPNDEREQERQDITYHSLRLTLEEQHFFAPIPRPTSILDVGTGTGIWAMDVADEYPDSNVVGVDLSPIQPTAVPPNLEFQVMDADEEWTFNQKFDLIHTRLMNGFSIKSWPFFYDQAYKVMKPGGWVEHQEFDNDFKSDDGTMPSDGAVRRWQDLWEEGIAKFGLTGRCFPETMKQQMEERGFNNVHIRTFRLPIGPWPKDKRLRQSGLFFLVSLLDDITGLSLRTFTQGLGWSVAQLEVLLMEVRKEWKDNRIHSYCPMRVFPSMKRLLMRE